MPGLHINEYVENRVCYVQLLDHEHIRSEFPTFAYSPSAVVVKQELLMVPAAIATTEERPLQATAADHGMYSMW